MPSILQSQFIEKGFKKAETECGVTVVFIYTTEKFLCIVWSMQSAQHVKCSTYFLGLFCCPWRNVWRWAMHYAHQLEVSHQQRKSNRKYAEYFPFYGLWDAIFRAFGCNSSRDTFCSQMLDSCSGTFPGNGTAKEDHTHYAQNQITTLKIWFCYT